ncbi:MAG: hypothetical protein ABI592_06805 [Acidobacteriota bacterium]
MRPTDPGAPPVNTAVAREERDVRISALLKFGFWLTVVLTVALLALWGLFRLFAAQERSHQRALAAGVSASLRRTPSEPRLEALPLRLRAQLRASEDARLSSYGWIDRSAGIARIPIDRAMELIVARGVPGGSPFPPGEAPVPAGSSPASSSPAPSSPAAPSSAPVGAAPR